MEPDSDRAGRPSVPRLNHFARLIFVVGAQARLLSGLPVFNVEDATVTEEDEPVLHVRINDDTDTQKTVTAL
jgi:hypothetical protein